ncbi:PAS domain-containing protein [Flammeovirgaceae bacterium SG7u.111]|nr:PAS domain-containing protein [Flammeovirgaceae bacterium SG7u.132]WPO34807.1 PAS domain-containing protein [Flammeovirgaceae bacterium SG7u.111]
MPRSQTSYKSLQEQVEKLESENILLQALLKESSIMENYGKAEQLKNGASKGGATSNNDLFVLAADLNKMSVWEWYPKEDLAIPNKYSYELFGFAVNEENNILKRWGERLHPDHAEKAKKDLIDHLMGRSPHYNSDFRYHHPEKGWVWINSLGKVVDRDENGNAIKLIGVSQDITNRKEVEQALKENEFFLNFSQKIGNMGSWLIDMKEGTEHWSEYMFLLHGLPPDRTVPDIQEYLENVHPDDQDNLSCYMDDVMEKKQEPPPIEFRYNRPDTGETLYFLNRITFLDIEKNIIVGVTKDITAERIAQEELNENYAFRNSMINNAAEGLCVFHNCEEFPFVHFTVWNDQMIKLTGYTQEEINELGWYQSLYPNLEVQNKAIIRMGQMREGVDITGEEWTIRTKDGFDKTISLSTSIIKVEDQRVFVMALLSDVTEKERYKKTIERQNKELLLLNATKDKFFSIIAHDLKNPTFHLQNLTEMLSKNYEAMDDSQRMTFLQSLNDSSKKMASLLEDLLIWARSQMGSLNIQPQAFNINDLVKEQLHLVSDLFEEKELSPEMILNNRQFAFADLNCVKTALRNLISNAIKFSNRGGTVTVETSQLKNGTIQVSVTDEGVGIPKERLKTLFQIEHSITTSGTEKEKGTGLGLIISKEFLNKSHSDIWVESKEGKGSCFTFILPSIQKMKKELDKPTACP